mgnify:CR=1 FL=1
MSVYFQAPAGKGAHVPTACTRCVQAVFADLFGRLAHLLRACAVLYLYPEWGGPVYHNKGQVHLSLPSHNSTAPNDPDLVACIARAGGGAKAARGGAEAPDVCVQRAVGGAARAARRARVGFRTLVLRDEFTVRRDSKCTRKQCLAQATSCKHGSTLCGAAGAARRARVGFRTLVLRR